MAQVIDDELRSHLEELTEDLVTEGLSPEAAAVEAHRRFGDDTAIRSELRALHPFQNWPWLLTTALAYLLLGVVLYIFEIYLLPGSLFTFALETLIVNWWIWLVLGIILCMSSWLMQFYGLDKTMTSVWVMLFALVDPLHKGKIFGILYG